VTVAERIATWTSAISLDDIPDEIASAAKLHFLDTLGCALAADALGIATAGRDALREEGGSPQATVVGLRRRLTASQAAFANGMLAHGLDYDDTHAGSVCHVSAVVVPAALAVGESVSARGAEVLAALVAGNETTTRIGMAAPAAFHHRGFHPTSVCGVFGATAAAARLRGLDAARTVRALGIAGSLAGGILEYLADGSETKPIHAAHAARSGVTAAAVAANGGTGPTTVLEGRFGLFATFADIHGIDLAGAFADLRRRWETPRIAFKPYPACHFIHAPIDAAAKAVRGRRLAPEEIREIVVRVPEPGVSLVLEPAAAKARPRTPYDAKFSLPYSVAAMLIRGEVDIASYSERSIADERVLAVAERVRYEIVPFATFPRSFPGGARITLADGTALEADLPHQRGDPENPMTTEEVVAKFRANAGLRLDREAVERLIGASLALEKETRLSSAFAALGRVYHEPLSSGALQPVRSGAAT
jgi:2-methylcitrate dehydratase PrpD